MARFDDVGVLSGEDTPTDECRCGRVLLPLAWVFPTTSERGRNTLLVVGAGSGGSDMVRREKVAAIVCFVCTHFAE